MRESGGDSTRTECAPASAANSRTNRLRPRPAGLFALLALALGSVAILSWRIFPDHVDRHAETVRSPSTDPVPEAPLERPPVAPDPPPPTTTAELLQEANLAIDRLVEAFPDDADAVETKARMKFRLGDVAAAVESWEQCLELDPAHPHAYYGLGLVAAEVADHEKAVSLHRKAISIAPGAVGPVTGLADALLTLGEIDEAIDVLETHLETNPAPPFVHVNLGFAYMQARKYDRAIDALQTALELHPNLPRAQFGLATALARLGRKEESRQAMDTYQGMEEQLGADRTGRFDDLAGTSASVAAAYAQAAAVYHAHGRAADAETLLQRATVLDPLNRRYHEALKMLQRSR